MSTLFCCTLDEWVAPKEYQDSDTQHLVFEVRLCRWFNTRVFPTIHRYQQIHVTRWVDKTHQEAGSWAPVASTLPDGTIFSFFFYLIVYIFIGSCSKRVIAPSGSIGSHWGSQSPGFKLWEVRNNCLALCRDASQSHSKKPETDGKNLKKCINLNQNSQNGLKINKKA